MDRDRNMLDAIHQHDRNNRDQHDRNGGQKASDQTAPAFHAVLHRPARATALDAGFMGGLRADPHRLVVRRPGCHRRAAGGLDLGVGLIHNPVHDVAGQGLVQGPGVPRTRHQPIALCANHAPLAHQGSPTIQVALGDGFVAEVAKMDLHEGESQVLRGTRYPYQ